MTTTELHPDCIEDCCWPERLRRAGGPTPITWAGCVDGMANGVLRSNDDGEVEFVFDRLPWWNRDDLQLAEDARLAWLARPQAPADGGRGVETIVGMNPELGMAVDAAVELLGIKTVQALATWLDLPERLVKQ